LLPPGAAPGCWVVVHNIRRFATAAGRVMCKLAGADVMVRCWAAGRACAAYLRRMRVMDATGAPACAPRTSRPVSIAQLLREPGADGRLQRLRAKVVTVEHLSLQWRDPQSFVPVLRDLRRPMDSAHHPLPPEFHAAQCVLEAQVIVDDGSGECFLQCKDAYPAQVIAAWAAGELPVAGDWLTAPGLGAAARLLHLPPHRLAWWAVQASTHGALQAASGFAMMGGEAPPPPGTTMEVPAGSGGGGGVADGAASAPVHCAACGRLERVAAAHDAAPEPGHAASLPSLHHTCDLAPPPGHDGVDWVGVQLRFRTPVEAACQLYRETQLRAFGSLHGSVVTTASGHKPFALPLAALRHRDTAPWWNVWGRRFQPRRAAAAATAAAAAGVSAVSAETAERAWQRHCCLAAAAPVVAALTRSDAGKSGTVARALQPPAPSPHPPPMPTRSTVLRLDTLSMELPSYSYPRLRLQCVAAQPCPAPAEAARLRAGLAHLAALAGVAAGAAP
jgi:hypothetical protein